MRTTLLALAVLLTVAGSPDEVRTHDQTGTRVRVTDETTFRAEIGALTLVRDGDRRPYASPVAPEIEGTAIRRFVDRILQTEDGVRTEVERHFEEVRGNLGDLDPDTEQVGVLSDRTVRIRIDESEEDGVLVELTDDGVSVDERHLRGLALVYPEERLLPGKDVEPGSRWRLDGATILPCLGLEAEVDWFDDPDEITLDAARVIARSVGGEVTVTYVGCETDGEETIARLGISFALSGDGTELPLSDFLRVPGDAPDGLGTSRIEVSTVLEGEGVLWVALGAGRLVASETQASATVDFVTRGDRPGTNTWFELSVELELANERSFEFSSDDEE